MSVKPGILVVTAGGIVLTWSAITGKQWDQVLRYILSGRDPRQAPDKYTIQGTSPSDSGAVPAHGATGALGTDISSDAQQYQGAGYVWGGAPGTGSGNWDCSSFANAVIGRDLGLAIPLYKPGAYHGQAHGPNTLVWLVWSGAFTIKRQDAEPGDLAVWQTHMGIIIDNGVHMISALDPALGTRVTTIHDGAPRGEIVRIRRLKAVTSQSASNERWIPHPH
jgi:cell wall-associated NlpC family hydrolase